MIEVCVTFLGLRQNKLKTLSTFIHVLFTVFRILNNLRSNTYFQQTKIYRSPIFVIFLSQQAQISDKNLPIFFKISIKIKKFLTFLYLINFFNFVVFNLNFRIIIKKL